MKTIYYKNKKELIDRLIDECVNEQINTCELSISTLLRVYKICDLKVIAKRNDLVIEKIS